MSETTEEVLASLVGSLIVGDPGNSEALALKAVGEAVLRGAPPADAVRLISELRSYLESIL
jgi:hypothetical protein